MKAPETAPVVTSALDVPPMVDPDRTREVFSNDVSVQVRDGAVQLTFCSIRPVNVDPQSATTSERAIVARVALPVATMDRLLECCAQIGAAMRLNQAVPGAEGGKSN